jgi:hypothetical protein
VENRFGGGLKEKNVGELTEVFKCDKRSWIGSFEGIRGHVDLHRFGVGFDELHVT